jgi:hypothetical protein
MRDGFFAIIGCRSERGRRRPGIEPSGEAWATPTRRSENESAILRYIVGGVRSVCPS